MRFAALGMASKIKGIETCPAENGAMMLFPLIE